MFRKVLIANRGEIANRILATLKRLGIASVAVCSDAERFAPWVLAADEAVCLGPPPAAQSYLDAGAVLAAAQATGAEAIHPGYGFLSESAAFAERLADAGIAFIGPSPDHLRAFGLKHTARELAQANGVPLLPGSGLIESAASALAEAQRIGYPVMLKSTAGGGGIGMQLCAGDAELRARFEAVRHLSRSNFGDDRLYLEKFVARARHVEVQIFGDGNGNVVTLGERDCSLQRRNQKVVEETPAPGLAPATRTAMHEAAARLGRAVAYASAGTIEYVYDAASGEFYFLEVNTRLQVEHGITEAVFGVDLVEWMICQAAGELDLPAQAELQSSGAAIEARIYAEDPGKAFQPSTGSLTRVAFPGNVRVDRWIETGSEVTPFYDPLLAKVIVRAPARGDAIDALAAALEESEIWGIRTNVEYVRAALALPAFRAGEMTTQSLNTFAFGGRTIDVLAAGTQSTVQAWPGRVGYWAVGVPPSGPMDEYSFRMANRLAGNADGAPALELTLNGPRLHFNVDAVVALAGARMAGDLDGAPFPHHAAFEVAAGATLTLGAIDGPGCRTYLAVRNGIGAPEYLGSRATFTLGKFGGPTGAVLCAGDVLTIARADDAEALPPGPPAALTRAWSLGMRIGPHGAPEFFTPDDIETLFLAEYEVHYNSARTGVRLIGPKPKWARADGGEAGLHPSNIHDNAYAIGALDFTGDMPILLGPDGPSLGGFVCPAVLAGDELWKMGQLRPGDTVRFVRRDLVQTGGRDDGAVRRNERGPISVCYRIAGDRHVLVEFGPMVLDLALRLRVHLLWNALREAALPGIVELTPGIRSLQVHYDPQRLPLDVLLDALEAIERALPAGDKVSVPSRIVYLPLSWDDEDAQLAMRKYQELVRPNAPWCPSNIEFIRRINGLDSIDDVRRIVFDASYLVLGLGDVYLGAPVATPVDPRHRLVTTKYNPARTWTPENAVGIGGAYLCIYGMEGPGGYQLCGRTIQMWNTWRATDAFEEGKPWLLRFFDQLRFYPVTHEELTEARASFPFGRFPLRIEETTFDFGAYASFLHEHALSIAAFKQTQQAAFEAERLRWAEQHLDTFVEDESVPDAAGETALPDGALSVEAPVPGSVWKVEVETGQPVLEGQLLFVLEAMKMEIHVTAPVAGLIVDVLVAPGRHVQRGQRLAVLSR